MLLVQGRWMRGAGWWREWEAYLTARRAAGSAWRREGGQRHAKTRKLPLNRLSTPAGLPLAGPPPPAAPATCAAPFLPWQPKRHSLHTSAAAPPLAFTPRWSLAPQPPHHSMPCCTPPLRQLHHLSSPHTLDFLPHLCDRQLYGDGGVEEGRGSSSRRLGPALLLLTRRTVQALHLILSLDAYLHPCPCPCS